MTPSLVGPRRTLDFIPSSGGNPWRGLTEERHDLIDNLLKLPCSKGIAGRQEGKGQGRKEATVVVLARCDGGLIQGGGGVETQEIF